MRFLVDAQLPPALSRWLTANGCDAVHVADMGMQAASDQTIWDRAVAEGWIIITKDEDFAQRRIIKQAGPTIVWLRWPNTRRHLLLLKFEEIFSLILAALSRGETLIEVI